MWGIKSNFFPTLYVLNFFLIISLYHIQVSTFAFQASHNYWKEIMKALLVLFVFIYVCLLLGLGEVLVCRSLYLNGILSGYHCPSGNNMVANITRIERSKCFFLCMQTAKCMVMAYNKNDKQCELFNNVCVEVEEHDYFALTALGPPRLHSIEWGPYENCLSNLVLVNQIVFPRRDYAVGRLEEGGMVLPGLCEITGSDRCKYSHNSQQVSETTYSEYLYVSPGSPILWVPWSSTSGADLPTGAIMGGHLDDGTDLYVAKMLVGNSMLLGYHNPKTGSSHTFLIQPVSQVSLLVLL